jgi:hypothetical protein
MFELPADDISPLIKAQREVSVRVNPLGITGIHNGLTCRSDGDGLLEISGTRLCDPGNFRSEACYMIFLFAECCLGDEHWEVAV